MMSHGLSGEATSRSSSPGATDKPSILIISEVVPETAFAGSLLLYRLLEDYPAERLLVLGPLPQQASGRLNCEYRHLAAPLGWLMRTRLSRAFNTAKAFSLGRIGSGAIARRIGPFQADVVLTVMQNWSYYGTASRFARAAGLPLAIVVHDPPEPFERGYSWAEAVAQRRNARAYQQASVRFCISPEMKDALSHRYGAEGDILYPNRSPDLSPRPVEQARTLRRPGGLTVGYAGTLSYGYDLQLLELLPAFEAAGCHLRVYAKDSRLGKESAYLSYGGFDTPVRTWQKVKEECDAVLLPYAWEEGFRSVYAYHFPSKLPEYLALGMPVLMVGPAYATGIAWAMRNPDAAVFLTDRATARDTFAATLRRLSGDPDIRVRLAQGALSLGSRDFDPFAIKAHFLDRLREVSEGQPLPPIPTREDGNNGLPTPRRLGSASNGANVR